MRECAATPVLSNRGAGLPSRLVSSVRVSGRTRGRLSTSAPGLGSPRPHLHRNWAHPSHICTGTGLALPTSAPGLGSPAIHAADRSGRRSALFISARALLHACMRVRTHDCTLVSVRGHLRVIPAGALAGGPPRRRRMRGPPADSSHVFAGTGAGGLGPTTHAAAAEPERRRRRHGSAVARRVRRGAIPCRCGISRRLSVSISTGVSDGIPDERRGRAQSGQRTNAATSAPGLGLTPATSAPGLGLLPATSAPGRGLTPATSAPGLGHRLLDIAHTARSGRT